MVRKDIRFFIVILIIGLAIFSRFIFLDMRVLHHDESVNYFFANGILEGRGFIYDPLNYHGPFYFFAIYVSFLLFGVGEFSLRFPSALFGVLVVLVPLIMGKGKFNRYLVASFLLLSPSLLYYSRYSIHETSFVFFSLMAVWIFSLIIEKKSLVYLPVFSIILALLFTIKETVVILGGLFFVLVIVNHKRIRALEFRGQGKIIFISILLFLFFYLGFFSSFSTNSNGVVDSVRGFFPWIERGIDGDIGHFKPFYYYLGLLFMYELPLLILAFFGCYVAFSKYRNNVLIFSVALWFLLILLIYSLVPYKTPWLIINMSLPMCFIAAFGFSNLRIGKYRDILLILIFIYLVVSAVYVNFINPIGGDEGNKFAYVYTDKDILRFVQDLDEMYVEEDRVQFISKDYWPLPFYLRDKIVGYLDDGFEGYGAVKHRGVDFFVFNSKEFDEGEVPKEYKYEKYRLREGVELVLVSR